MLIKKLEIIEDLTKEKETELKEILKRSISEDKVKWIGIECINNDGSILDTFVIMQQIIEFIANINDNLSVITSIVTGHIEDNQPPAKIIIKFFDGKPNVIESIII